MVMRYQAYFIFYLLLSSSIFPFSGFTQVHPGSQDKPGYVGVPYTSDEIIIDGDLDDWNTFAEFSFSDTNKRLLLPDPYSIGLVYPGIDTSSIRLPLSRNRANVCLCWNRENLYIAFRVKDEHLLAQWIEQGENPNIYLNDATEIYIDSKNDSRNRMDINDYQFIVDINNQHAIFRGTLSQIKVDTLVVPKEPGQNLIINTAVRVTGNITGQTDSCGQYCIEVRIPFISIGLEPQGGDTIRMDICVDDADYLIKDLEHPKRTYYTWAFNWTGYNDFGYPEVWKPVVLTGKPSWYERITESYQRYWLPMIMGVVLISGIVTAVLFLYSRKKSLLPTHDSLRKKKDSVERNLLPEIPVAKGHNAKIMQEAIQYIQLHLRDPIRSEDVARHLSLSLRTLQRISQDEMNCTPTGLISIIRLRHSAEYLRMKKGNVSEAAYESGFANPGYFSRLFRQHFGITPLEYLSGKSTNNLAD
jgi:AraC-like DNA-binding protein